MKCAKHPNVETNLTCGRCDTPVCPKCFIQTPVGIRCRKCSGLKRIPTYEISRRLYLKAVLVAFVLAISVGIGWGWFRDFFSFPLFGLQFGLLWGIPAGYVIGEFLSVTVNRKRGKVLQYIAAATVILSYIVSTAEFSEGITIYLAFDLWAIISVAFGILIAISRLR